MAFSSASRQQKATPEDYHLLGLEPGASVREVKRAYRDLVKRWHPDRFAQSSIEERSQAEERFKAIQVAYQRILNQPLKSSNGGSAQSPADGRDPKSRNRKEGSQGGQSRRNASRKPKKDGGASRAETPDIVPRWIRTLGSGTKNRRRFLIAPALLVMILAGSVFFSFTGIDIHFRMEKEEGATLQPPGSSPSTARLSSPTVPRDLADRFGKVLESHDALVGRPPDGNPRISSGRPSSTKSLKFFTLGSTKKEVLAVQGPPDKMSGNRWTYGLSEVRFRKGRVVGYDNFDGRLRVVLRPSQSDGGKPIPDFFTLGSSKDEVLRVQGTPTSVRGNRWTYGFSEVRFEDGRVVAFDNYFGNLKIRMLPSRKGKSAERSHSPYFTIGSTPDEVLAAQGTPTSIRGNIWFYRFADVLFRDGRVRWVNDPEGRLRFRPPEAFSQQRDLNPK